MVRKYLSALAAGSVAGTATVLFPAALRLSIRLVPETFGHPDIQGNGYHVLVQLTQALLTTPLFMAIAGAIALKLSYKPAMGLGECILTSEMAGLAAVASLGLLFLAAAYIRAQELEGETIASGMLGTLNGFDALAGMLAYSLFSIYGGLAYYAWKEHRGMIR